MATAAVSGRRGTASVLLFSLLSIYFSTTFSLGSSNSSSSSCPIDLSYIQTFPWNKTDCQNQNEKHCCFTLLSLFGIGLAQHLKDTATFQLPNLSSASSCLSDFQTNLAALSLPPSLVMQCFQNSTQFVIDPTSCANIVTIQDWRQKVGPATALDTSCNGKMTLTHCGVCVDAGKGVYSQLIGLDPNSTKCFYFTILYAIGIVNELGPMDPAAANCILGLSLDDSATKRINKSDDGLSKETLMKLVFEFLGALIGVILAFGLIILYRRWDRKHRGNATHRAFVNNFRGGILPQSGAKWFRFTELNRATNGFSNRNLIGQGASGVVYKGTLPDGTLVAIKQIVDLDSKGDDEFCNEVEIISKIRHRNLLSLRGCCISGDIIKGRRRYLVYDFMSNGSLADHLFSTGGGKRKQLTWPQRKNVILDVARGLAYLHYGLKPAIYHRDIKANNILLDSDLKAKVADFGLAVQNSEGQSHLTRRVAGTHGYLAPEYALYGQLTEKSDVYSFGIVILETMSGRKVLDTSNPEYLLITDWAYELAKSENLEAILEESIREKGPKGVMERFVRVGILCAHVMVALRPTIAEALKMLEGDIDIPSLPDRPLPLSHESFRSSLWFSNSASQTSRTGSSSGAV